MNAVAPMNCWHEVFACRVCASPLESVADLGNLAVTSLFPAADEYAPISPLSLVQCSQCRLLQLQHNTDPWLMYQEGYGYASGVNESMVAHLTRIVESAARYVRPGDAVLDIGCNDGTLLKAWEPYQVQRHGVDPVARDIPGCHIRRGFFRATKERFRVVTSIAMFYDLDDPVRFARDVATSLTDGGVWIVEVGYAGALLEGAWDGICHEHLEYYGVTQLVQIGERAGLVPVHVEFNPTNGGSVLMHFKRSGTPAAGLTDLIVKEAVWKWDDFASRIQERASAIASAVRSFRRVYVLGASTKGNTILQVCGLTSEDIVAAVDRNPQKVGRYLPGMNIQIISEAQARAEPPDAYLVLPYHFREGLLERERIARDAGVKFIFPLPQLEIL